VYLGVDTLDLVGVVVRLPIREAIALSPIFGVGVKFFISASESRNEVGVDIFSVNAVG